VLCSAPLLDGLDPQDVAALLPAFRFATVHVDQELITQGESGAAQMFIVLNGRFAVTRRHRGERAVSAVLGPGDSVGELSVFDPGRATRGAGTDRGSGGGALRAGPARVGNDASARRGQVAARAGPPAAPAPTPPSSASLSLTCNAG